MYMSGRRRMVDQNSPGRSPSSRTGAHASPREPPRYLSIEDPIIIQPDWLGPFPSPEWRRGRSSLSWDRASWSAGPSTQGALPISNKSPQPVNVQPRVQRRATASSVCASKKKIVSTVTDGSRPPTLASWLPGIAALAALACRQCRRVDRGTSLVV